MFELIIFIIIGVTIYRRYQNSKGGFGKSGSSLPDLSVTTANRDRSGGGVSAGSTGAYGQSGPAWRAPGTAAARQKDGRTGQSVYARQTSAQEAIREAREDGNDTTAYLMEKAEADAREHQREKYEEQKRLHETRGGLAVAERYLDGESVPQGKRCVNCGYCAAQNLIPRMPGTRYSCYFCREPLN